MHPHQHPLCEWNMEIIEYNRIEILLIPDTGNSLVTAATVEKTIITTITYTARGLKMCNIEIWLCIHVIWGSLCLVQYYGFYPSLRCKWRKYQVVIQNNDLYPAHTCSREALPLQTHSIVHIFTKSLKIGGTIKDSQSVLFIYLLIL